MAMVSRLVPKSAERMRQARLVPALIDFVRRLHAGAGAETGPGTEPSGNSGRGEPSTGPPRATLDVLMHAQLFVINLVLQACCES